MFQTLKQIARAVFSDQLRLRREKGHGIRLALAPAGSREFSPSEQQRDEAARAEAELSLRMLEELTQLLAASPSVRGSSPHLLQLQRALRDQGLVLLKAMPLPSLVHALVEFEEAVSNWSPVGLATLRSRMAVAVAERRRAGEADHLPVAKPVPHADVPRTGMPEVTELDSNATAAAAEGDAALLAAYAMAQPAAKESTPA